MPSALARLSPPASTPVPRGGAPCAETVTTGAPPGFEAVLDLLIAATLSPAPQEAAPPVVPQAAGPEAAVQEAGGDECFPDETDPGGMIGPLGWPETALAPGGLPPAPQPGCARPAPGEGNPLGQVTAESRHLSAQDTAAPAARAVAGAAASPATLVESMVSSPDVSAPEGPPTGPAPVRAEQASRPASVAAAPPPPPPTSDAALQRPQTAGNGKPDPVPASSPPEPRGNGTSAADAPRPPTQDKAALPTPATAREVAAPPAPVRNVGNVTAPASPPAPGGYGGVPDREPAGVPAASDRFRGPAGTKPVLPAPAPAREIAAPPAPTRNVRDTMAAAGPPGPPAHGPDREPAGVPVAPDSAPLPEPAPREVASLGPAEPAAEPGTEPAAPAPAAPVPLTDAGSRLPSPARAEAATAHHPPPAAPERPVADAIVRTREGQVEVVLNPVELGRVTLMLGAEGDPGHLGLYVERPETADLIRRHSDQLLRELRDNGMPEARLDLLRQDGQGQHRGGGFRRDPHAPAAAHEGARAGPADRPASPAATPSRLDIRM